MRFFERRKKPVAGIPEAVFREVDALMQPFLHRHGRPEAQFSLSANLDGNAIIISENRPAYLSKKVESFPIGRADYDTVTGLWLQRILSPLTDVLEREIMESENDRRRGGNWSRAEKERFIRENFGEELTTEV